jgi:hypothetical protein
LKNEGNILLIRDFNSRTIINQDTLLRNDSNHNPLWLDEELILANSYTRIFKDLTNNFFGIELFKLGSYQDLLFFNGVMKWPNSDQRTCIHGTGSSVIDYVIYYVHVSNQIETFDLLNDHEFDSDHTRLTLTLNFAMHMSSIEENSNNQRKLLFDKSKFDLFLKDLNSELHILTYKHNIEYLYHNFTTTLSSSIKYLSFEVSFKNNSRMTNNWYDKECKIVRKSIMDASNESLKLDKINMYKSLIKRKKNVLYQ